MTPDELKFFLIYIAKQFWREVTLGFKALTNLARPKLWMFIFSGILIYQLAIVRKSFEVFFTLAIIIFIWMWDYWDAGHWRGEMRKNFYKKIKKERKEATKGKNDKV
jgi:hypothetical protein